MVYNQGVDCVKYAKMSCINICNIHKHINKNLDITTIQWYNNLCTGDI